MHVFFLSYLRYAFFLIISMHGINKMFRNRGNNVWSVFQISLQSVIYREYQLTRRVKDSPDSQLMSNIQLCTRYKSYSVIKPERINRTDTLMSDWIHKWKTADSNKHLECVAWNYFCLLTITQATLTAPLDTAHHKQWLLWLSEQNIVYTGDYGCNDDRMLHDSVRCKMKLSNRVLITKSNRFPSCAKDMLCKSSLCCK